MEIIKRKYNSVSNDFIYAALHFHHTSRTTEPPSEDMTYLPRDRCESASSSAVPSSRPSTGTHCRYILDRSRYIHMQFNADIKRCHEYGRKIFSGPFSAARVRKRSSTSDARTPVFQKTGEVLTYLRIEHEAKIELISLQEEAVEMKKKVYEEKCKYYLEIITPYVNIPSCSRLVVYFNYQVPILIVVWELLGPHSHLLHPTLMRGLICIIDK